MVRTRGGPTALTGPLRAAIQTIDPLMAVHGVRTMDAAIAEAPLHLVPSSPPMPRLPHMTRCER